MVKGLSIFVDHFRQFNDQFVLIGGTACDLAMTEAGLEFRATKEDVDGFEVARTYEGWLETE